MSDLITCEEAEKLNSDMFAEFDIAMAEYITNKQTKFNNFEKATKVDENTLNNQNVYNEILSKKLDYDNVTLPKLGTPLNINCCLNGKLYNKTSKTCINPIVEDNYKTYEGAVRNTRIVGKHKSRSIEDCKKICNDDINCGGFNYDTSDNTCNMYTKDTFKNNPSYTLRSSGIVYDNISEPVVSEDNSHIIVGVTIIIFLLIVIGTYVGLYFYLKKKNSVKS